MPQASVGTQTADPEIMNFERCGRDENPTSCRRNSEGQVVEIGLSNNKKATDAGLVHLKGLTGLQTLALRGTKITDAGVVDLRKALPACEIFK